MLFFQSWRATGRVSKDDWSEWLRRLSIELLKESPSPALRSCWALAQSYNPLARCESTYISSCKVLCFKFYLLSVRNVKISRTTHNNINYILIFIGICLTRPLCLAGVSLVKHNRMS